MYIDDIDLSKKIPQIIFGTHLHIVVQDWLQTKEMKFEEKFLVGFEKDWQENIENEKFAGASKEEYIEQAKQIVNDFPKFIADNFVEFECISIEEPIYEQILENKNLKFKGFIDCVLACKNRKGKTIVWILDFKTTSWGWALQKKIDSTIKSQLVFYKNYWMKKHEIVDPQDVRCGFVLLKRQAKEGKHCELFSVSVGDITKQKSLTVLNNMVSSLERGYAFKNIESCDYCEFHNTEYCKFK